ncbi:MAG: cyclic nucleotide-binding domain-containing protein [Saprospiraceae bacterium]
MQAAPLLAHIHQMLPLNTAEEEALRQSITLKKLRRKQYLLQEGDICKHYNFVLEGCLRMYYVDEKGIEHILQFATENWWVSDIGSFHSETPSQLYIDALEPSVVLQIKKQDLLHLYSHYPKSLIFAII